MSYLNFNIYSVTEMLIKRNPIDEIKYIFKLFINKSSINKITLEDLQKFNQKLKCNLINEEMELMIKEFDLDQDGSSKKIFYFRLITLIKFSFNIITFICILYYNFTNYIYKL